MASSVVGLFDTYEHAHFAVRQLLSEGFNAQHISVVASDTGGTVRRETVDETGNMAGEGAVSGAASGMLVGGLIGLLVGATTLVAPPVGFVIAGPIAGLLTGAGIGLVSGGLLGALIGLGIPEEEAHIYAESVRRGGVLVSVNTTGADALRVEQIFARSGAVNVTERAALYRSHGFTTYDPKASVLTPDEIIAERARLGIVPTAIVDGVPGAIPGTVVVDEVIRVPNETSQDTGYLSHYNATFVGGAWTYEGIRPAYQFGHDLAVRPEFRNLDWSVIEPQARLLWERANPAIGWDIVRDAVHFGWGRAYAPSSSGATML